MREAATGLVQIHEKYKHRGVKFVGLTLASKECALNTIQEFGIPWPSGYGASEDTIRMLQSFDTTNTLTEMQVGKSEFDMGIPDAMMSTLYVIGRDGRVAWHDSRSRLRHRPTGQLLTELENAIEEALGSVL